MVKSFEIDCWNLRTNRTFGKFLELPLIWSRIVFSSYRINILILWTIFLKKSPSFHWKVFSDRRDLAPSELLHLHDHRFAVDSGLIPDSALPRQKCGIFWGAGKNRSSGDWREAIREWSQWENLTWVGGGKCQYSQLLLYRTPGYTGIRTYRRPRISARAETFHSMFCTVWYSDIYRISKS